MQGLLLIKGPFNHVPSTAVHVALDFGYAPSSLLHLPQLSSSRPRQLLLQNLILTGLIMQQLPTSSLDSVQGGAAVVSSLPLWAISRVMEG